MQAKEGQTGALRAARVAVRNAAAKTRSLRRMVEHVEEQEFYDEHRVDHDDGNEEEAEPDPDPGARTDADPKHKA